MSCRISDENRRWIGGIVPYKISSGDFPKGSATRMAVRKAIAHWNAKSEIVLVPHRGEDDSVLFVEHAKSCASDVGRIRGQQEVRCNLDTGGFGVGSIIHEIGHVVGLWHEHTREDRDDFVTINEDNIERDRLGNFDQHISDGDDVGDYDYGSIMHYGRFAFPIDRSKPTIEAPERIGQRDGLSDGDRAGVRETYEKFLNQSRGWRDLWTRRMRAAVNHPNGKAYFFRGNQYMRFDFKSDRVDKIGLIGVDGWKGLWTSGFNAAVNHPNGKAYFFKGDQYQRFDFARDRVDKTASIDTDGWKGLWKKGVEAAVNHPNGQAYFFRRGKYKRFNFGLDRVNKTADIDVDGWKGLWRRMDAAVNHPNGKAYFFRRGLYKRFDFEGDRVDKISRVRG